MRFGNSCQNVTEDGCNSIFFFTFQLLHKNVDSIEKRLTGNSGTLTLKCKDFQLFQLEIPSVDDCLNVAMSVEQLSNIGKYIQYM